MDAIVLAGGLMKSVDPAETAAVGAPPAGGPPAGGLKCLQEVGGKTMVQWALDALGDAHGIERVVVVGLPPGTPLRCARPLTLIAAEGDMLASVQAAGARLLAERPDAELALIVAADAPLITGEMLDWVQARVRERGDDVTICAVERSVMEARFPGSKRTYVRLKDVEACGADVAACRLSVTRQGSAVAERLSRARKNPLQQAAILGPATLWALMRRRLTLAQAEEAIHRRLGARVGVILSPFAELGMDVDKPAQLALVREALAARA